MSTPSQLDSEATYGQQLDAQLSARNRAYGDLAAQQVKLADLAEQRAGEVREVKAQLLVLDEQLQARHKEIATLSRRILDLEDEVSAYEKLKPQQQETSRILAERTLRMDALEQESRQLSETRASCEALLTHVQAARLEAVAHWQHQLAQLNTYAEECHFRLSAHSRSGVLDRLRAALRQPNPVLPPPAFEGWPTSSAIAQVKASTLFDENWYARHHLKDAPASIDAAWHFLAVGAYLGLDPSTEFSTIGYLVCNPDVAQSGLNPLLHYMEHGESEGRRWKMDSSPTANAN